MVMGGPVGWPGGWLAHASPSLAESQKTAESRAVIGYTWVINNTACYKTTLVAKQ